jgi:hypothetical protein
VKKISANLRPYISLINLNKDSPECLNDLHAKGKIGT